ncbi:cell division ATPase MinD [Candidatus Pacearchaeota archaeon]|nr:cell division ATPase MinD [Candidatus Pacearchaeota archaeon]
MAIITVTSGKGGVGKTTTSINIGAALNALNREVIIVDANLTTPNVGLHLGAPIVPVNLNHVMQGKAKVSDAIYEHDSGTKVIPSSLSVKELRNINHSKLKDIARKLKGMADFVILDCAAGLGDEAVSSIEVADELIIVTNPEITAVTDALKTAKLAQELGKKVRGVIVNRVSGNNHEMSILNIKEMLDLPILGVIPEDKKVLASLRHKDAVIHMYPYAKSALAYKKIAAKIAGVSYKEPGFWQKLMG